MRNLYLTEADGQGTAEDLAAVETEISAKLPQDYADFLLAYNGGVVPGTNNFLPLAEEEPSQIFGGGFLIDTFFRLKRIARPDLALLPTIHDYAGRILEGTIPIADNAMGDLLLLGFDPLIRGKVYAWDHEREGIEIKDPTQNTYLVAESFTYLIDSLQAAPPLD